MDVEGLAQMLALIAEHSMCQPGRPRPTGSASRAGSPSRLPQHEVGGVLLIGRHINRAPATVRRACAATGDRSRSCSAR